MRQLPLHRKAGAWASEVVQLFRGPVVMEYYRTPPEHYLGYTVDGKVPVILIPGITNKWGYMRGLGNVISKLGHPVHIVPELKNNLKSIPESASILHKVVEEAVPTSPIKAHAEFVRSYIEKHDLKGAVLVAHSKGGIIGKYLLAHYNHDGRVLGMVAVSSPFSGSSIAKYFPHKAFRELHTDSPLIRELTGHTAVNKHIISIYASYDTHVWHKNGSYLEGALENIELHMGGHSIVDNKKVQEEVVKAVEKFTRMRP